MKTKLLSLMLLLAISASAQVAPKAVKPDHAVLLGKIEEVNKIIQTQKKHHKSPVDHIPGKGTFYTWDTTSQAWYFDYASRYQYNPANQVTSEVQTDEDGFFTQRITTTYNAFGAPLLVETEGWYDNKWNPGFMSMYTYNSHDELEQYEEQIYLAGDWAVMFGFRNDIKYDPVAHTEEWTLSYWDGNAYVEEQFLEIIRNAQGLIILETLSVRDDSVWLPVMQSEYDYAIAPNTTTTTRRMHNGTGFVNVEKMISVYENGPQADDRLVSVIHQSWNAGTWFDYRRDTYTYDSFGGYEKIEEMYTGGWQNSSRSRERKDQNGNYIQTSYETWNGSQWEIVLDHQYALSYDAEENLTERVFSVSNDIGFLQPISREVYEEFPVSTGTGKEGILQLSAYPNPVKDQLQLRFTDAWTGELRVSLKDMTGRTIHRQSFSSNAASIDMSAFPQGIYILEAGTEGKSSMLKIIKQ
jgi:hypothetical protein